MKERLNDELRDLESIRSSKGSWLFHSIKSHHILQSPAWTQYSMSWLDWSCWLGYEHEIPHPYLIFWLLSPAANFMVVLLKSTLFQWLTWKLWGFVPKCSVKKERRIKMLHCFLIQVDLRSYYQQSGLVFSKGMTPGIYLHISPSIIFQRNLLSRKSIFVHPGFPCERCTAEIVQSMQGCHLPGQAEVTEEFRNKWQPPEFLL